MLPSFVLKQANAQHISKFIITLVIHLIILIKIQVQFQKYLTLTLGFKVPMVVSVAKQLSS